MIRNQEKEYIPQVRPFIETRYPRAGFCCFHMQTTGHYWRNSAISGLWILSPAGKDAWRILQWTLEQEEDEYTMLEEFGRELASFSTLMGYNSTSFHIPYLEQKYRAYGLPSPFFNKEYLDLFHALKSTCRMLHLTMKLEEIREFLCLPSDCSEAETVLCSSALLAYRKVLSGDFTIVCTHPMDSEFMVTLRTDWPLPGPFRIHHDAYYLIGDKNEIRIKIKLFENRIRVYYTDVQNYWYLPREDTAVHKTMAAYIDKEHRIKADASNCYTYAPYTADFPENREKLKKYICSLLSCR